MHRFVAVAAVCVMSVLSASAFADTLSYVSSSAASGGVSIYPYAFQVNGSKSTANLMCIDYAREVSAGETWRVSTQGLALDGSALSTDLRAYAWLFGQLGAGQYTNSDIQWAAWSILDPSGVKGDAAFGSMAQALATTAMGRAASADLIASGYFSEFTLYVPTSDRTGWTYGEPQRFIGAAQTPESSSLVLLGSGLVGCVGAVRRRVRA